MHRAAVARAALAGAALAACLAVCLLAAVAPARAGQYGSPPAWCRAYSADGDVACAGLEVPFHTSGVARSPSTIWAGQWLFSDAGGALRLGSCTYNRGLHPRADTPARPTSQAFPQDPGGAKGAYLGWRYGDTSDDLTAAALWAVFHFYAQDPAGSTRATDPEAPLVPSLTMLAAASGRADLQRRAVELDAEAARFTGVWALQLRADGTSVTASVSAGTVAVPGVRVQVAGRELVTDANGRATVVVATGATVRAVARVPAPLLAFIAEPVRPHAYGGQVLVTAAGPAEIGATLVLTAPTTTAAPATTTPPTTPAPTAPSTTPAPSIAPATSTTSTTSTTGPLPTSTVPPGTTEPASTTTTSTTTAPTTTVPVGDAPTTVATVAPPTLAPATTPAPTTAAPATSGPPPTAPPGTPPATLARVPPPTASAPLPPPTAPAVVPSPPGTLPVTGSRHVVAGGAALALGAGIGILVGLRRRWVTDGAGAE